MARRQRNPALEQEWRERVASWASSGLSVRAFCLRRGLVETAFYFWKRELRSRDAAVTAVTAATSSAATAPMPSPSLKRPPAKSPLPTFVPLTVIPSATVSVEIRCPSGHVVLVPACDVSSLANLFAALAPCAREEPSC